MAENNGVCTSTVRQQSSAVRLRAVQQTTCRPSSADVNFSSTIAEQSTPPVVRCI